MRKAGKCILSFILAMSILFSFIPQASFASTENTNSPDAANSGTIDFAQFLQNVQNSNYNYDGKGITVKWSPTSACTNPLPNHNCLFDGSKPTIDGNNPQRGQAPNAQYQIFSGQNRCYHQKCEFCF